MKRSLTILILLSIRLAVLAQIPDSCRLRIGTNLAGPTDYGSEWPFVDIMKNARTWTTQNDHWVNGGQNPWDSDLLDSIPQDENGYPLELPAILASAEAPQIASLVWAATRNLKSGIYTILYEGEGQIDLWGDAELRTSEPGRITFELFAGRADIFLLKLVRSTFGNHIRNIRVLMPDTEATYQQNPWTSEWLEKLAPFQTLRFMDWGHTNNSRMVKWENRPKVSDYTYTSDGIPYEWMIEICNLKQADAWVCIPHQADDDYIRQMARLFRDNLDPNLKLYVEYSNEIWNWIFEQTHYVDANGDPNLPWPEKFVPFIQHALDTWSEEFDGEMHRLIRVVGAFEAWQDVSNRIVFNMRAGSFDAFSPAAYFSFTDDGVAELESLGADATGGDVLRLAKDAIENQASVWIRAQKREIADVLDIPMLFYEGGQHLTPSPFGSVQPYGKALVEAQRMPAMYDLYQQWYDTLRTVVTGNEPALLMNFSFIGPVSPRYGSWGLLEHQFNQNAPFSTAPKYQAVLDNIYDCGITTKEVSIEADLHTFTIYPNPTESFVDIVSNSYITEINIFDGIGRRMSTIHYKPSNEIHLDLSRMPTGIYFLKVKMKAGNMVRKLLRK